VTPFRIRLRFLRVLSRLLFWGGEGGPPARAEVSGAAAILARTEELNRNAERHWQAVAADPAARAQVLGKPWGGASDTGPLLCRLGIVLTELDLGIGHKVLDFAAGSCWLSLILSRLGCDTVSLDVSPTALELGREMFRGEPRPRPGSEARFLAFDGHRFPLPSGSIDRLACFDGFHHVPNPDEVLGEMFRVLAEGGRAVLAEPGEGHSHAEDSLVEAGRFGILEGDIHLPELIEKAKAAGFSNITVKPYPDPAAVSLSERDYLRFMAGALPIFPVDQVRENLRQFSIVVLRKGAARHDSRNPKTLLAALEMAGPSRVSGRGGETVVLAIRVKNTGDTVWLHEERAAGGFVRLGAHLAGADGVVTSVDHGRAGLPRDVLPGESLEMSLSLALPRKRGQYRFVLDMVDEQVGWFEGRGSSPLAVDVEVNEPADSRTPSRLQATIRAEDPMPLRLSPGVPATLRLTLTNTGDTVWLPVTVDGVGAVAVGGHLTDPAGDTVRDVLRVPLSRPVAPGDTLSLACTLPSPREAGSYVLRVDLVAEGIRWFAEDGTSPLELPVVVA